MNISTDRLQDLTFSVAKELFGQRLFRRRPLMDAVERRLRATGVWTIDDDVDSASVAPKSVGLAAIDYAISSLKRQGRLLNTGRDQWKVPD